MRCAKIRLETGVIHCQPKTTEVLSLNSEPLYVQLVFHPFT